MRSFLLPFLAIALAAVASSCGVTNETYGQPGVLSRFKTANIEVREGYSEDPKIRRTIDSEMRRRGFQMTTGRSQNADHVVVSFGDTWHWDIVMYLLRLEIDFIDPKSGGKLADAEYRNSAFHNYANGETVVRGLFAELDRNRIFRE